MTITTRSIGAHTFIRLVAVAIVAMLAACDDSPETEMSDAPPTDSELHCAPEPGDTTLASAQACASASGARS